MTDWRDWDHLVKLDPDKELPPGETVADVAATGTDALLLGGTTGVTREKVLALVEAAQATGVPVYQEPNAVNTVVQGDAIDGFLLPTVLNAGDPFWGVGGHALGAREFPDHPWDRTTMEGYVVLNPDAAVASYTEADCEQTPADVAAYATVAERLFDHEIVYLEYSGTLGDPEVVEAAVDATEDATVFYGGGVRDYESARTMGERADVVVVGDLVHDEGVEAVRETVAGVRDGAADGDCSRAGDVDRSGDPRRSDEGERSG